MEDVVNTGHSVLDGLRVADITDVELDLLGCFRVFCLKLMAHIVLLLLIAGEDADFLEIRIQKVLQHGGAERTGTTSDHKGCVIKCRHFISSYVQSKHIFQANCIKHKFHIWSHFANKQWKIMIVEICVTTDANAAPEAPNNGIRK